MECLRCGADIGSSIGMCSACRDERQLVRRRVPDHQSTPNRGGLGSLFSMFFEYPTIFLGILIAPFVIYLLAIGLGDEAIEIKKDAWGLALSTSDGSSKVVYSPSSSATETVRALNYDVTRLSFRQGAFGAQLAYLTEEEYAEFKAVKGCKAGFLNQHVKHLLVVPKSQSDREAQKKLAFRSGDRIVLRTTELKPVAVTMNGSDYPPEMWFSGNKIVTVDSIKKLKS